ncbi:MAG: hypothetical protein E6Q25_02050 [Acinetobacter sp.]|nr:MAG: hypothetical protein E6Q25_02050 [Acinetobacter sp.]
MSDMNDYDDEDREDQSVDEDEAKAAQTGGGDEDTGNLSDADLAEAESLTVTAKQHIREQLEDEVARFLAQGGRITQVPPDESGLD